MRQDVWHEKLKNREYVEKNLIMRIQVYLFRGFVLNLKTWKHTRKELDGPRKSMQSIL